MSRFHSGLSTWRKTEMAATGTFSSILDRPSGEIKRPPPMPTGTYVWVTKGLPRLDKSSQKQTEFAEFTVAPTAALDDVDMEALKEVGGLAGKESKLTFYLTEKSAYRLTEFMVNDLQIDDDGGKKSSRAMLDESPNHQFLGHVKHTPSKDGKGVFWEIDLTAPLES
jgi:hypothetical protein